MASTQAESTFNISLLEHEILNRSKGQNISEDELYLMLSRAKLEKLKPNEIKFINAYEANRYSKLKNMKLSKLEDPDDLGFIVQHEFIEHIKSVVTKQSTKPIQGSSKNEGNLRRNLLNKIRRPDDYGNEPNVSIEEIAKFIKKEITKGWTISSKQGPSNIQKN